MCSSCPDGPKYYFNRPNADSETILSWLVFNVVAEPSSMIFQMLKSRNRTIYSFKCAAVTRWPRILFQSAKRRLGSYIKPTGSGQTIRHDFKWSIWSPTWTNESEWQHSLELVGTIQCIPTQQYVADRGQPSCSVEFHQTVPNGYSVFVR